MSKQIIVAGEDLSSLRERGLESARRLADWLVASQCPNEQNDPTAGTYYWCVEETGKAYYANNWNLAFAVMGLLAAEHEFGGGIYQETAFRFARFLKSLQIFSPFLPQHYGAFREMTPQTSWCYVRDALSVAWSMLVLYQETGDEEYLQRAKLWYEWFRKEGLNEWGWPKWGVEFEPFFGNAEKRIFNEINGCFHGGSLNFFYQLHKVTGNLACVGDFYRRMIEILLTQIQQEDGFFRSVVAATGKVPENDPQNGLHRGNDDLSTLGLAGAYRLTGDPRCLHAIGRFFSAVFARQGSDGGVEASVAANAVILNALYETRELHPQFAKPANGAAALLDNLLRRQVTSSNPLLDGGLDEVG
ncbi:MAG: hypothetical protein IJJ33_09200 [Victivallales bacterium]|nr:hypothetical protein [Victivallales bacterium]